MPIPDVFPWARWRGVTKADTDGSVGISFDLADGTIVRLRLSRESALWGVGSIQWVFGHQECFSQSESSSGIPSLPGSTPAGQ